MLFMLMLPLYLWADWRTDMDAANTYRPQGSGIQNLYSKSQALMAKQGLNPNPAEAKAFVDQGSPDSIGLEVKKQTSNNIYNAPHMKINLKDPTIKNSKFIQDHSYNIVNGIQGDGIDCSHPKDYKIEWKNKRCRASTIKDLSCQIHKQMDLETHKVPTKIKKSGQLENYAKTGSSDGDIKVEHEGVIHHISLSFQNNFNNISCFQWYDMYMNGALFGRYHGHCGGTDSHMVYIKDFSSGISVKKNEVLHFTWRSSSGGFRGASFVNHGYSFEEDALVNQTTPFAVSTDSCEHINLSENGCVLKSNKIIEGAGSKSYHGFTLYEPWWVKESDYTCGGQSQYDDCQGLISQGCQQLSSVCSDQNCYIHENVYSCPIKKYTTPSYVCGDQNYFCSDGKCAPVDHHKTSTKDFNDAISGMAATGQAGDDVYRTQDKSGGVSIFKGASQLCKRGDLGTGDRDCCDFHRWFGSCGEDAKKLRDAYLDQRAVYVGERCIADSIFGCLRKGKVYCVFPNRLATDVQVQGRAGQLGLGFGSAKSPNCRGLTPDELQKIDLGKIDFSNFHQQMDHRMNGEIKGQKNQQMQDRIANDVRSRE